MKCFEGRDLIIIKMILVHSLSVSSYVAFEYRLKIVLEKNNEKRFNEMSEMKNCSEEVDFTAASVSHVLAHVFGSPGASATEVADLSGATVLKYLTNSYTNL